MTGDSEVPQDPVTKHPQPEFEQQDEDHLGWTGPMDPPPDHGEDSYRGHGLLEGRKALVTGGDSGIGRAVALAFAREGADILLAHLPDEEEDAKETSRLITDAGRKAVPVACEIREEQQCGLLIDCAVTEFGRIDILVNNAAYQMPQPDGTQAISTEQFDRVMRTNLYGMFWLSKMALRTCPRAGRSSTPRLCRGTSPARTFSTTR